MKPRLSHIGRIEGPIHCQCGERLYEAGKKYVCHNDMCPWFGKLFTAIVQRAVLLFEAKG